MLLVKEFVPGMIERGRYCYLQYNAIPLLPAPGGGSIYTAGKAAATSIIMSLANEVKGTGVHVFA